MLSRTAENIYWTARLVERADATARLLQVAQRIALLPSQRRGHQNEWTSVLAVSGLAEMFEEKYGTANAANVSAFFLRDRDNPSSVLSCMAQARDNIRTVRTAVTTDVWEALNTSYHGLLDHEDKKLGYQTASRICDEMRASIARFWGAVDNTLLRNDGYDFLRAGYYLERADNTARLLDVKYYVLLPSPAMIGSGLDNEQWSIVLRALSAHRAFHWVYGGDYTAAKIAHFLILNPASPRSLASTIAGLTASLDNLANHYGRSMPVQSRARTLFAELAHGDVNDIISAGLHEFLTRFLGDIAGLNQGIADAYNFGDG